MSKEAIPGIIPANEWKEELEKDVAFYTAKAKSEPYLYFTKKHTPNKYPTKFKDKREELEYQMEEIRRCIEGYDGLCGKGYGWLNYAKLRDPERGKISPTFRAKQEQYFRKVEELQTKKGSGIVGFKRRRFGYSSMLAWDAEHDCMTKPFYQIGMNSKTENDSRLLFRHVKFIHQNLPDWLRPRATASDRRDFMHYAWFEKDPAGNKITKGLQSWINVTSPVPSAHEGQAYSKLYIDEAGKIEQLSEIWAVAEDCLRLNTRRVGLPILMGTVGEIDKDGKGLLELYKNAEAYDLERFPVMGYHGLICDEYGNDMFEDAVRWIVYERERTKSASQKVRQAFIQKYPLEEKDAFNQVSGGGVGDVIKINDQIMHLMANPPLVARGWMRKKPDGGVDFVPNPDGEVYVYERPQAIAHGYKGMCLPPDEKILTNEGLMNIQDVNFSQKLINEDGKYVDIKKLIRHDMVDEPVFTFKTANTFRTTTFTQEHPILVSDNIVKIDYSDWKNTGRNGRRYNEWNFKYIPAADVKVGQWVKIPNIYSKNNDFDIDLLWENCNYRVDRQIKSPLKNPDFWWFIGLFLGDGFCTDNHKITIVFNSSEYEHADRLIEVCKRLFNRECHVKEQQGNCLSVSFCFEQLNDFINKHFGRYSHGKKLPEWSKKIDTELKKQLILGYLDSDGSIMKSKKVYYTAEFVSINLGLLEGFQDILFSIGIVSSVSKLRGESVHLIRGEEFITKECFHLRLSHHDTLNLVNFIDDKRSIKVRRIDHNNLKNVRKRPKLSCFLSDDSEFIYFRIKEISSKLYTGKVYNFECETNTFLCHHITTHNCDPAEDDDVKKTRDTSDIAIGIAKKAFGLEPPKLVARVCYRPAKLDEAFEQAGMLCEWYDCQMQIEMNKGGWRMKAYFENNYPKRLALAPVSATNAKGGVEWKIGVKMNADRKEQMKGLMEDNIDNHVKWIQDIKLLEQHKVFGDDHADDDLAIVWGWLLILMQSDKVAAKSRETLSSVTPTVNYVRTGNGFQLSTNKSKPSGFMKSPLYR